MSPVTWASLGSEYQKIFMDVMHECDISERELSRKMDAEAMLSRAPSGSDMASSQNKE